MTSSLFFTPIAAIIAIEHSYRSLLKSKDLWVELWDVLVLQSRQGRRVPGSFDREVMELEVQYDVGGVWNIERSRRPQG